MTPPREDGITPLSHDYWVMTMESMMQHPAATESIKQLAEMCLNLITINQFDEDTGAYLDSLALLALEESDGD